MEQLKGKQTPGVARIQNYTKSMGYSIYTGEDGCVSERWYDRDMGAEFFQRMDANATLYAEAHNVANETQMWPRDMQERIKKLETLLDDVRLAYGRSQSSVEFSGAFTNECIDRINEALGITTPSTIN